MNSSRQSLIQALRRVDDASKSYAAMLLLSGRLCHQYAKALEAPDDELDASERTDTFNGLADDLERGVLSERNILHPALRAYLDELELKGNASKGGDDGTPLLC